MAQSYNFQSSQRQINQQDLSESITNNQHDSDFSQSYSESQQSTQDERQRIVRYEYLIYAVKGGQLLAKIDISRQFCKRWYMYYSYKITSQRRLQAEQIEKLIKSYKIYTQFLDQQADFFMNLKAEIPSTYTFIHNQIQAKLHLLHSSTQQLKNMISKHEIEYELKLKGKDKI